jgi:hypothetical protein
VEGVPLLSGAYSAKSVLASAQRCVNLYLENNPANVKTPMPTTHYQRPGKKQVWAPPAAGAGRGLYTASNGDLFAVVNGEVFFINAAFATHVVGSIVPGVNPVSMADNGITGGAEIALVDGTTTGYSINMNTFTMAPIVDPTGVFTGADVVAYLETFFIFNTVPNTQNFCISEPNSLTFNVLDLASKSAYADNLITLGIRSKELWLFGNKTSTEPWFLSGAFDFPFESIPSTFLPYGCAAKYGMCFADAALYWISINNQGQAIFVKSDGYNPKRISTFAIENEVQGYATISDAIASSFQIEGHTFVCWSFPTANITLVFDEATQQWAQWAFTDQNGNLNRDNGCFYASAYNSNFVQDWQTGAIYEVSGSLYDDNGSNITFIRGFPVLEKDLSRVTHNTLRAYMEMGTDPIPNDPTPPVVLLFISDDGGKSYYDPITMPLGSQGQYDAIAQATRLGQARTRVYELVWSASTKMSLNGVYVDPDEADS